MMRGWQGWIGDVAIVAAASAAAFVAHASDRPITAVLIHLVGVILVSASSGQLRGMLAAGVSFVAYLFLDRPTFAFTEPTLDNTVPLFAFLLSAIGAGTVVGRLRDNVALSAAAQRKSEFLLAVSERLQRVLRVEEIEGVVTSLLPSGGLVDLHLYVSERTNLVRAGQDKAPEAGPKADAADGGGRQVFMELPGATEPVGLVELTITDAETDAADLRPFAALLALTVERCLLLERFNEIQAAERTEELKDAILSSVSHDLRTPLTAIDAAASALLAPNLQIPVKEREELLATIVDQCARLNRYTGDLLDMGRIQAGISRNAFETVELGEILAVALQQVRELYPEVRFMRSLASETLLVNANAPMLQQAFVNLIDNAAKHGAGEHGVQIVLELVDKQAVITIDDSGPGIPPAEQDRVFERFHRVGGSGDKGGSGLGLYIAKGFVEAFGGRIGITSPRREGRGTRMTITLPASEFTVTDELENTK